MKNFLFDFLSLTKLLPAVAGWVRYTKIHPLYRPFLWAMWIGCINELFSTFLFYFGKRWFNYVQTGINSNMYVLAEACLYVWQLKNWKVLERYRGWHTAVIAVLIAYWCVENFLFARVTYTTTSFRVLYSVILVLLSLVCLNRLLLEERGSLLKQPVFLITVSFIVLFTFKALVNVFWLYGLQLSADFRRNIVWVFLYLNGLTNIIFTFAIIWMPSKHRFTLPSQ